MSIRQKQTAFIKRLIYALKRAYGFTITLHKITEEVLDYETGNRTSTIITQKINRAVLLPGHVQREMEKNAESNFQYGGFFDTSTRRVLVDTNDLNDFEIEVDDYFIWDGKRWQISDFYPFEFDTSFVLIVRMVEGTPRHMVEEVSLENALQLTQTVGAVKI